jgi:hypothetical protein
MISASPTDVGHTSLLLLITILGVAFIRLGGVNWIFLMVYLKFITTFPIYPTQLHISSRNHYRYSNVSSIRYFFLIAFSRLSIFLLSCAKDCFMGLGFFLPFLAGWMSDFFIHLSPIYNNPWYCAWYIHPHDSCTGCNISWFKLSWESCP